MARTNRTMYSNPKRVGEMPPLDGGIIDPPPEGETEYGVTYGKTTRVGAKDGSQEAAGSTETAEPASRVSQDT